MATTVQIELVSEGFRQLLCSEEIGRECEKAAQAIAAKAGGGYHVSDPQIVNYGGGRISYLVVSDNYEDWVSEAEDKALTKAVHG